MQVTFISNYINHHQIPLSNAFYELLGDNYHFIQTEPMEEDRIKMGWQDEIKNLPYVMNSYEQKEQCKKLLLESDVVIGGGVRDEEWLVKRLEKGLFTVRYSERIYKTGQWRRFSPRGLRKKYHDYIRFRKQEYYLLCAGGYVADDYRLIGAFPKKMLKWGYFPANYSYDIKELLAKKEENKVPLLLWTGRMLSWKHPEYAVEMAANLKQAGYPFHLKFIGDGEKKEILEKMVKSLSLQEEVSFDNFMPPKEVRRQMEKADIYLMTSDRMEGWGAVVNEAMNSGCVVVASHMVGATPYLIKHEENGLIFATDNVASLTKEVEKVINNTRYRKQIGKKAYETIDTLWNAKVAAKRFLKFCESRNLNAYTEGPCSIEKPVRETKMYGKLAGKEKMKEET